MVKILIAVISLGLLWVRSISPVWGQAEALKIGLPFEQFSENVLTSSSAIGMVSRAILFETLLNNSATGQQSNSLLGALSSAIKSSPDYRKWSIKLNSTKTFSNQEKVKKEDVLFSLGLCSAVVDSFSFSASNRAQEVGTIKDFGSQESWIDLEWLGPDEESIPKQIWQDLVNALSRCPILEEKSSRIFADLLGTGTSMIGSSPYFLSGFVPHKSYQFRLQPDFSRKSTEQILQRYPVSVEFRALSDSNQGLSALRSGDIAILFGASLENRVKAQKDDTLQVANCSGFEVIYRKSLALDCRSGFSVQQTAEILATR